MLTMAGRHHRDSVNRLREFFAVGARCLLGFEEVTFWQFDIKQTYQVLDVDARVGQSTGGANMVVRGARLRGEEIRLAITGMVAGKGYNTLFAGKVSDGRIEGNVRISDGDSYRTIPWKATRQP